MKYFRYFCGVFFLCFSAGTQAVVGNHAYFKDDSTAELSDMRCISDVASTSAGRWLYAFSFCDAAINIFERDLATQAIVWRASIIDDAENQGINPNNESVISPDDKHLYVLGSTKAGGDFKKVIAVYTINLENGALELQQVFEDFVLQGTDASLVMASDGKNLYLGTVDGRLYTLVRGADGSLSQAGFITRDKIIPTATSGPQIADVILSADDKKLFVGTRISSTVAISVFDRNAATGLLSLDSVIGSDFFADEKINAFEGLALSPDAQDLYFIARISNQNFLAHAALNAEQQWVPARIFKQLPDNHPGDRLFCPDGLKVSENGKLLYLVDACAGDLQVWHRNPLSGELRYLDQVNDDTEGFQTRIFSQFSHQRFSSDQRFLYGAVNDGLYVMDIAVDNNVQLSAPIVTLIEPDVAPAELDFEVTLTLTNMGTADSYGNDITLAITSGRFVAALVADDKGTCDISVSPALCRIERVPAGGEVTIVFDVRPPRELTSIIIDASTTQYQKDLEESNNTHSSTTFTWDATFIEPEPELNPAQEQSLEPEKPAATNSGGGALSPLFMLFVLLLFAGRLLAAVRK